MKTYKGYKKIIMDYLAKNRDRWYKAHELSSRFIDGKWVGTRGARDCRDLAASGAIERRMEGKLVAYKAIESVNGGTCNKCGEKNIIITGISSQKIHQCDKIFPIYQGQ